MLSFCSSPTGCKKDEEIAVGIVDEDEFAVALGGHARILQCFESLLRVGDREEELRLEAGARGTQLDVQIGCAGGGEAHAVVDLFGRKAEVGIELLHRGAFFHRQIEAHQLF